MQEGMAVVIPFLMRVRVAFESFNDTLYLCLVLSLNMTRVHIVPKKVRIAPESGFEITRNTFAEEA